MHPPLFAFCSPHPASLTQLDSGFNIQFLEIQFLQCPEGIEYSPHRAVHPRHQCRGFSRWIGKHLGVYRDQFEKWMDGLMEWEVTEKQCPASILKTAC
jgi:hypothetical protein